MKTIKITLLSSLLLFVLALSFAFAPIFQNSFGGTSSKSEKSSTNKKVLVPQWFIYKFGNATISLAVDPANYRPLEPWETLDVLCIGSETICAIRAEPNPNNPGRPLIVYGSPLVNAMNDFFSFGVSNPTYLRLKTRTL